MAPRTSTVLTGAPAAPPAVPDGVEKTPQKSKTTSGWNPTSLTWSEHYNQDLEKAWGRLPGILRRVLVTVAVFTMGLAMSGESAWDFPRPRPRPHPAGGSAGQPTLVACDTSLL